jgi:hypothetical protein
VKAGHAGRHPSERQKAIEARRVVLAIFPLGPLGTSASRNIRENAIGIDFERAGPPKAKGVHWHYSLRFSDCALDVVARVSDAIRTHGLAIGSDPEKFNIKKHPAHPADPALALR